MKYIILAAILFLSSKHITANIFENLIPIEIVTGIEFSEGPAWHNNGYLVFSDLNGNVIYKWSESKGLDTLLYPAGNSNGIASSLTDDFIVCRQGMHDIARMDTLGNIISIVSEYDDKRLNSPNDVTLSFTGSIYFTDPDYGIKENEKELGFQGLYCLPHNKTDLVLIDSTLIKPNGLTFASDWRTLYVNETSTNTIYSYFLRDEYIVRDMTTDKQVFLQLDNLGEIDGITSDVYGNIYVAFGDGGIKIYDKNAQELGTITFPINTKVRNLCFGGKYNNTLFITAGNSLYKTEIRYYGDLIAPGILGVPTDKSIIFNTLSDNDLTAYIAYGTSRNNINQQTPEQVFSAEIPIEITLNNLSSNTRYYYEFRYKKAGKSTYTSATVGDFNTQRSKGESFSFAVEADPHLDESSNYTTFRNMLQNAATGQSDFLIDLGDNFLTETLPIFNENYAEQRNLLYRHFWDSTCKSMPLFIVIGNHEGELRWRDEMFDIATSVRKKYYPTPVPDDFYSGSEAFESVGQRENYYAWNWGEALFVVIDPYGYTEDRSSDPWCFTLGKTQYDWFRSTLEQSNAKYKFVFAHQLVGGDRSGRGGAEKVDYFEMGGKNEDGSWGFDDQRPGWGKPLHQLMQENGVQIYFHGHDHFYAEQEKDGIIYQLVPQPSFPGYTSANDAKNYGYTSGLILPNSGHLKVSIEQDSAKVEYIGAYHVDNIGKGLINGQVRRTYYVKANGTQSASSKFRGIKKDENFQAYIHNKQLILKSTVNTDITVNLYSIDGKHYGSIFKGRITDGDKSIKLPADLDYGLYLLVLQTKKLREVLKIIL